MPDELRLPDLAPQGYTEFFDSLREAIPTFSSNWTNYNDADPGITLLQLFAFVADATAYRINRIPVAAYRNFLLLAAGTPEQGADRVLQRVERDVVRRNGVTLTLGGEPVSMDPTYLQLLRYVVSIARKDVDPAELHAEAQQFWSEGYRVITSGDFEAHALECTAGVPESSPMEKVKRAFAREVDGRIQVTVSSGYQPQYQSTTGKADAASGELAVLSVKLRSPNFSVFNGYAKLVFAVGAYLDPRRPVGTPISVVPPRYPAMNATLDLVVEQGRDPASVLASASARATALLDPLTGGTDGKGWPYGRPLTGNDLVAALRDVPGIDPSQPIVATAAYAAGTEVGGAIIGSTTIVEAPPLEPGFPCLLTLRLRALRSTWTIQVGEHGRVGWDTRLPVGGAT